MFVWYQVQRRVLVMRCAHSCRDNEYAYVQVNGKTCWSKRLVASSGKQTCGQKHGNWHEERIPVTCTGTATGNGEFKVRVYTTLNSGATDESFGIDNAVLSRA